MIITEGQEQMAKVEEDEFSWFGEEEKGQKYLELEYYKQEILPSTQNQNSSILGSTVNNTMGETMRSMVTIEEEKMEESVDGREPEALLDGSNNRRQTLFPLHDTAVKKLIPFEELMV